jgi:hypothetical protein
MRIPGLASSHVPSQTGRKSHDFPGFVQHGYLISHSHHTLGLVEFDDHTLSRLLPRVMYTMKHGLHLITAIHFFWLSRLARCDLPLSGLSVEDAAFALVIQLLTMISE